MPILSVALPQALRTWVDAQVAAGGYGNASEYIRDLIRGDQRRHARVELEQRLLEAFQSGSPVCIDSADWQALLAGAKVRLTDEANREGPR